MDSHSYRDVHDKNLKEYGKSFVQKCELQKSKGIWTVIRTEMCMTITKKNIESHSYRDVNDENTREYYSHLYGDVHAENL